MKRQRYLSRRLSDQVLWLTNFAEEIDDVAAQLGLDASGVKADALWLAFVQGPWRASLRSFSKASTAYLRDMKKRRDEAVASPLPIASLPVPPPGVVPVPPGAMRRITKFVQELKLADGYDASLGQRLKIIGSEDAAVRLAPEVSLELFEGLNRAGVNVHFTKFGHYAVVVESRPGPEAPWEPVTIATDSPFLDERPLRVPGQPEMREYRLRFWDRGHANGEWSNVSRIAVGN
jgi:hypothetical protein